MRIFFVFVLLLLCISTSFSQVNSKFCEQITALKELVEKEHYSPKKTNDSLSKHVLDIFLKALDSDYQFFLEEDITLFKLDTYLLDNYILDKDCSFIESYIKIFEQRIKEAKTYVESLREETLDYSGKDTLYFNANNTYRYFKNKALAKKYWSKRIRYRIITKSLDEDSLIDNVKRNFTKLESNFKPKVIQNQLCVLDEILQQQGGIETYVKETFLNAYASYQDPNSMFYNPTDKMLFENALSTSQLSFGIHTQKNDDGDIIVAFVIPGSPASINGNFEPNDIW